MPIKCSLVLRCRGLGSCLPTHTRTHVIGCLSFLQARNGDAACLSPLNGGPSSWPSGCSPLTSTRLRVRQPPGREGPGPVAPGISLAGRTGSGLPERGCGAPEQAAGLEDRRW